MQVHERRQLIHDTHETQVHEGQLILCPTANINQKTFKVISQELWKEKLYQIQLLILTYF